MKIIFLDFDGVMNTGQWYRQLDENAKSDAYATVFDPNAVANLAKIIEATGADIVISSSWKAMGLTTMREMWKERRLPGRVIGITPTYIDNEMLLNADLSNMDFHHGRGEEIKGWLLLHGKEVSHYVIFDDIDDVLPEQEAHLIQTDPEVGISEKDTDVAIFILNKLKYDKQDEDIISTSLVNACRCDGKVIPLQKKVKKERV